MAAAQVIEGDDEELVRVQWLAWADKVVPPARVLVVFCVFAGGMMVARQCVTNQHSIRFVAVQRAIRLVDDVEGGQRFATFQDKWLLEMCGLRRDDADG